MNIDSRLQTMPPNGADKVMAAVTSGERTVTGWVQQIKLLLVRVRPWSLQWRRPTLE